MVVPCKYLSTRSFSFGLAAVTEDGHKWFYIDYKGNKVCGDYAAVGNIVEEVGKWTTLSVENTHRQGCIFSC